MNLTTEDIRNHVGSASFIRGKDYFTKGNVKEIAVDERSIMGLVQGSEKDPYEVEIEIEDGEVIDSECSCPVGFACKHAAALAMKAILVLTQDLRTSNQKSESVVPESAWKKELKLLLAPQTDEKNDIFQLQILLKLNVSDQTLLLRPRIFDPQTGKTSITEFPWSSARWRDCQIYFDNKRGTIPGKQFSFFQNLASALEDGWLGQSWQKVPERKAGFVFQLLQQHMKYSVTLLGGQKGELPVEIRSEQIDIRIVIAQTGEDVSLTKKIYCQNQDITQEKMILVGDPSIFAVIHDRLSLKIHPVSTEAGTKFVNLFQKTVNIPKTEIPEFEKNFLPDLSKQYTLDIQTKNISLPEMITPKPLITMKLEKKMRVHINFGLIYDDITLPLVKTPETMVIDKKTVILNQQKVREIRYTLEQSLVNFSRVHQYPVSFILAGGIVLDGIEAAKFSTEIIPQLQKVLPDLQIQTADDLPDFTLDSSLPEITFNVEENEAEHDWFDLGITVLVGKEKVPFLQLFNALVEEQEYLLLESGRYFSLQVPQFDQLRKLLAETKSIRETDGNKLQISRFQAGLWEELQKLGIVEKQSEKWQQSMKGLLDVKTITMAKVPPLLQAHLRNYQHEGYSWLKFLRDYNLGGILADEMGLGKTIQTISLMIDIQTKKKKKPFLVIAPTSVVENWDIELDRFAPSLKRIILRAGDRSEYYKKLPDADVVITSYALFVRDFEKIKKHQFDTLILDEAQFVKNYQSKAYGLVRQIKTESKIALTGTPLENSLMELWSIFSIVAPGLFPDPKKFQEIYRTPIEKYQDTSALNRLRSRIRPFILRRQKSAVEKQLPLKNEQIIYLNLNEKHQYLYDLQLQHERKRVLGLLQEGGLKEHRFEILRSLMKMRQMCLHPQLVDKKHGGISATKIEALKDYIEEIVAEDHRILIFSQFTSFLVSVKEALYQLHVDYLYLDGQTKKRGELVKKFQEGNVPVFVISLKSGGFGLNLTAADYCILLDPWWNPAVEQQAVDRTHRIGQTKPVFVYKMIAKNTIEEKVLQLQQKKQKLFKNIMEDDNLFGSVITEKDIHQLFEF